MTTITSKSIYFTHDSNALSDEKIIRLRKKQGIEGYGIYFALLEKLSASNEYKIHLDYVEDIAYDWHLDPQKVLDVIRNYNLFQVEENYFYSPSHRLKIQYKDEKADKKRQAALARIDKLTSEQLSEQNTKAINARWNKHRKDKGIQANAGTDTSTIQANAGIDTLNKNKDIDKDKNRDKHKDEHKERNPSGSLSSSSSSSETNTSNEDYVNYDGIAIQEEITNHTPIFFNDDNVDYLTSNYNEHKKQIDSNMDLKTYEKILYFLVLLNIIIEANNNNTPIEKGKLNNNYVNDYLMKKQFNLSPSEVEQMFNSVRKDKQMNENLKSIINDVNHQLMKNE